MEPQATQNKIDSDDARAGSTPHIVRYMLFFSLFLAILTLTTIWITAATDFF